MASKYVPQIDYTSRDYAGIRDEMLSLIPYYAPNWTSRDPSDIGVTLVELFSVMGDILNNYIDRSANEAYISTASQRDSVLQIAKFLGYTPVENTASTVTLTFYNNTANPISVPALTQVSTTSVSNAATSQVVFETNTATTVPAKSGSVSGSVQVKAAQGVTVSNEVIGTSNGQVNQVFKLSQTSVIHGSISVVVNSITYTQVQYLLDSNGYDPVFTTYTNAAGVTYILFGDGVSGRIPSNTSVIYATYRVGGGLIGNVPANSIKTILTNNAVGLSVLNTSYGNPNDDGSAIGGADPESTDSIRINAPLSTHALNRAVSLSDYAALVKAAGVAKASAVADVYSSVTVYFVPFGDAGVLVDNVTPSSTFTATIPKVKSYLVDKIPANTTVTYQPPSYVKANIIASVVVLPKYSNSAATANVKTTVGLLFGLDNVVFQDTVYINDVYNSLTSTSGVASVKLLKLVRQDQDQTFTITNKALTSNVATITTSATHNVTVGQTILVSGVGTGNGDFDGTYVVTSVSSNTISYTNVYTNVSSASVSNGSATVLTVKDIVCGANEIPALGTLTLTVTGGIS